MREIEPDAIRIECKNHCQKLGVNLYENGEHEGDKYDDGTDKPTFKLNQGCDGEFQPLYSSSNLVESLRNRIKSIERNPDANITDYDKGKIEAYREFLEVFSE